MDRRGLNGRLLVIAAVLALVGQACGGNSNQNTPPPVATTPVTLTVWRVFDTPEVFDRVIERYQAIHPNIDVKVVEKSYGDYELEVANAIAAGTPPDIWMIRNDWLPKHKDKLQAMPDGVLVPEAERGGKNPKTNLDIVKDRYPDVVTFEGVQDGKVYGIPLSIDTLALYYNKDHLREAGITQPPTTWSEFVAAVPKLTKYQAGDSGKIERAGAAIGTAKNVNRATDVLMLLMLQNNTPMVNEEHSSALFNGALNKPGGGLTYPGTNALEFYTGFADPKKSAYTWNNDLSNSIDAFAQGKVSMIFSYAYLERLLLQKNPTLTYGVAPMPQVDNTPNPVDYPTYWFEVVSRNAPHSAEAWDFIRFLSEEGDEIYQAATGKPPAKRISIIPRPSERILNTDPGSPWSFQASTAGAWYRGTNPGKVEQIFSEMIENVTTFDQPAQVVIDNAAAQVTRLLSSQGTVK